jgi:hypothetical protein
MAKKKEKILAMGWNGRGGAWPLRYDAQQHKAYY